MTTIPGPSTAPDPSLPVKQTKTPFGRAMIQAVAICLIAGAIAAAANWQALLTGEYVPSVGFVRARMQPEKLLRKYRTGDVVIVDARPRPEYEAGHIAGAIHFDFDRFQEQVAVLSRWMPPEDLVVIVTSRKASARQHMRTLLMRAGYQHVRFLTTALSEWVAAGGPVATGWDMDPLLEAKR